MKRKKLRLALIIGAGVIFLVMAVLLVILFTAGRSFSGGYAGRAGSEKVAAKPLTRREAPRVSAKTAAEAPAEMSISEAGDRAVPGEGASGEQTRTAAGTGKTQPEERKRVYSGYAELLVDDVDETKRKIGELAEREKGYIENVYEDSITIRIPAENFSTIFREVQTYGDVLHTHEETVDVTDYYADLKARLDLAKRTRDRLYSLLDRTTEVKERIKILQEIRRLSEEIERINLSFQLVQEYISYSSITVKLTSRLDYSESEDRKIPFPWIESLHPLYPAFTELKGKVSGELPEDYAVFQKEKYFRAEASDGTRIRIGTTENEPRGDGKFWQEALGYNLRGKYADVRKENLGPFLGVLLTSKDSKPYYYFVGVSPRGKKLHVAELFFPDKKTYDERFSSLKDIFRGIRIR